MNKKFFGILVLCLFLFSVPALWCAQKTRLTILHTNDTHSTLFPYGPFDSWGGIARMSSLIKRIKARDRNVLVLNAGDVFVGTFEFNKYLGYPELKIMEGLYDVMCLGNHEFDLGLETLLGVLSGQIGSTIGSVPVPGSGQPVQLPVLCANVNLEAAPALQAFVKPYLVKQVGNLKVGLIGVLETQQFDYSPEVWALLTDPFEAAGQAAFFLKYVENVDIVVCLSHLGLLTDVQGLSQVPGIDIIVGGHTHDALFEPIISNGKIIVQAGEFGRYLGQLTVEYDGTQVKLLRYKLNSIDWRTPRDWSLVPILDSLRAGIIMDPRFGPVYSKRIAFAPRNLEEKWDYDQPERDTPLGNLVADGIKTAVVSAGYPAHIALEANGYIAHRIYKGRVVGNDVMRSVPYGYDPASGLGFKIDTVLLAGAQILVGLEYSVSLVEYTDDLSMQVSGLTFEYDSRRTPIPPDKLLEALSQGNWGRVDPASVRINGEPLDLWGTYWVALTDQLHKFLSALGMEPHLSMPTGLFEYNVVRDYMSGLKILSYSTQGRIIDRAKQ
jgi:5'-nucleotidase/UDP-sugar diphosphatase